MLLHFRGVLVWIGVLVFQDLNEFVETCGDDRAEHGAGPVDPVVGDEGHVYDSGPEGAGGIEAAAGEVDACEFGDEEGEADSLKELSAECHITETESEVTHRQAQ